MRPPTKSIFKAREWVQPTICRTPRCVDEPVFGKRFCPDHLEFYRRVRDELGNTRGSYGHDAGYEAGE